MLRAMITRTHDSDDEPSPTSRRLPPSMAVFLAPRARKNHVASTACERHRFHFGKKR